MSDFTTKLENFCCHVAGVNKSDFNNVTYIINVSASRIIGPYEIFDENYREYLNRKIIRHYYFWESGFETFARFCYELNRKMNEIMPYYNQLYESELLNIDPFINQDYIEKYLGHGFEDRETTYGKITTETRNFSDNETYSGESRGQVSYGRVTDNSGNTHSDTTTSGQNHSVTTGEKQDNFSDTPEQGLEQAKDGHWLTNITWGDTTDTTDGTTGGTDVSNGTNTSKTINSGSDNNSGNSSGTDNITHEGTGDFKNSGKDLFDNQTMNDYIKQITGKQGLEPLKVLNDLRASFLNIDMLIIKELQILFCNLF